MQKFPNTENKMKTIVKLGSIQQAKLYQRRAQSNENLLLNQRFYHEQQNDYDWFVNELCGKKQNDDTYKVQYKANHHKQNDDYDNLNNTNEFSRDYSLMVRQQHGTSENFLLKFHEKKQEKVEFDVKKMEFIDQGKENVQYSSAGFVCFVSFFSFC